MTGEALPAGEILRHLDSAKRAASGRVHWTCEECNYQNIGTICTHCGWLPEPVEGRVSSAAASALTMPLHHVEWPEDDNPTFTCTAEVGAKCRLVCAERCDAESWPCGYDPETDEPHAMTDDGECHVVLFLGEDEHYERDRYTGPIKVEWNGYGYDWEPTTPASLPSADPS